MRPWRVPSAWVAVTAFAGLAASGAFLGPWSQHLGIFLVLYTAAWIACAAAARSQLGLLPILAGACLFRLLLLPLEPSLSDDVFRYVWEGRVQLAGVNPYLLPPAAAELVPLRDDVWARVNHPEYAAIYPPLAQLVFRALAAAKGGVVLFKACFVMLDLVAIALVGLELHRRGARVAALALYAWNPLAVVEVAASGHMEPLGIACLAAAVVLRERRPAVAWAALAAGIATKYAALVAVPFFVLAAPPRPRALAAAAAVLLLTAAPYAGAGRHLFDSLGVYAQHWRYNDLVFSWVHGAVSQPLRARLVAAALLAGTCVVLALSRWRFEARVVAALAVALVLSPTVHPWYLLWPLALTPLVPDRAVFAWSGTIALAYIYSYPAFGLGPAAGASRLLALAQMLPAAAVGLAGLVKARRAA